MNVKRSFLFLLVALLAISISACTLKATPPPDQPVSEDPVQDPAMPTPGPTELFDILILQATQTFMAEMTSVVPPADVTPEVPPADVTAVAQDTPVPPPVEPVASPTLAPPVGDIPPITVPASYTISNGEFPYCIARRFNVDPGELLRVNGMSSSSIYYAGMTLQIPQSGLTFPGNRSLQGHPATYTVRTGETLHKIACYFGDVSPEQIAFANGLTAPYNLTTGQVLNIP
ncbi:LysM peptidoglycan-binding domain-containing protein [Chloroflexota bacterium]